jgi:hypothetical protein
MGTLTHLPRTPDLRAELDAATAATAAAIADPDATVADVHAAAEAEASACDAYWRTGPDAQAELEAGI